MRSVNVKVGIIWDAVSVSFVLIAIWVWIQIILKENLHRVTSRDLVGWTGHDPIPEASIGESECSSLMCSILHGQRHVEDTTATLNDRWKSEVVAN